LRIITAKLFTALMQISISPVVVGIGIIFFQADGFIEVLYGQLILAENSVNISKSKGDWMQTIRRTCSAAEATKLAWWCFTTICADNLRKNKN